MTPKPLPTTRVGDQVLLLPKPEIWRCKRCDFAVVMLRRLSMPQAVFDHLIYAHCAGEISQ